MAEVWTPPRSTTSPRPSSSRRRTSTSLGNSLRFQKEIAYPEFNADVSTTATTVGTAIQIVSAGAFTYEASPILIEFCCGTVNPGANDCYVILRDSTTVLGTLARVTAGAR